jgi:hypothetical protein
MHRAIGPRIESECSITEQSRLWPREVQGYLFGRPMTFDRAKGFLDELKDLGINAA